MAATQRGAPAESARLWKKSLQRACPATNVVVRGDGRIIRPRPTRESMAGPTRRARRRTDSSTSRLTRNSTSGDAPVPDPILLLRAYAGKELCFEVRRDTKPPWRLIGWDPKVGEKD